MIDRIIKESIDKYLKEELLMEYKDKSAAEVIKGCADRLEDLYVDVAVKVGSRNEYSITRLKVAVDYLRKLQRMFGG